MKGQPSYLTDDERAERANAHRIVLAAIRNGRLVRGDCERSPEGYCRGRIAAHHRNGYKATLDVVWLCAMHHGVEHYEQDRDRRMAPYAAGGYSA